MPLTPSAKPTKSRKCQLNRPGKTNRQLHKVKEYLFGFITRYILTPLQSNKVDSDPPSTPPPLQPGGEGWGIPYNVLYRDAPPERGTCFRLQVYQKFIPRVQTRDAVFVSSYLKGCQFKVKTQNVVSFLPKRVTEELDIGVQPSRIAYLLSIHRANFIYLFFSIYNYSQKALLGCLLIKKHL